jgi:hypothetical protein
VRPTKLVAKRAATNRTKEILTADRYTPHVADALKELLVAFAHGNQDEGKVSLNQLCNKKEVTKLNSKASELLKSFHASIWSLPSGF